MRLSAKTNYAEQHIVSISRHHDMDAAVRKAALDNLIAFCEAEKLVIDAEVAAEIEAMNAETDPE